MTNVENMVLEHLKRFQIGQESLHRKVDELTRRMAQIESAIGRIGRENGSMYSEIIEDRHSVDRLSERIERIERRLEIAE